MTDVQPKKKIPFVIYQIFSDILIYIGLISFGVFIGAGISQTISMKERDSYNFFQSDNQE